jgi:hypothetical protein
MIQSFALLQILIGKGDTSLESLFSEAFLHEDLYCKAILHEGECQVYQEIHARQTDRQTDRQTGRQTDGMKNS